MDKNEILIKLQTIIKDVLDNNDIVIQPELVADDIEGYDSLVHIQIVAAIQKEFGIKFMASEMISWTNFGSLIDCIYSKL